MAGRSAGAAAAISLLAACASSSPLRAGAAVFDRPEDYVGRTVRVCGYSVEPDNLWQGDPHAPNAEPVGLAVVARAPERGFRRGPRCITGRIMRTGCTVELICSRHSFEYGIRARGWN